MLALTFGSLAFEPRAAAVFRQSPAAAVSSPSMILGLKAPTKTVVRAVPASGGFELVDAPATTTSALSFNAFDGSTNVVTELEVFKAQAARTLKAPPPVAPQLATPGRKVFGPAPRTPEARLRRAANACGCPTRA